MKLHLPISVVLLSASGVSAFQNHRNRLHRMPTVAQKSTANDVEPVTKETLLAARDEIDNLLREKACGKFDRFVLCIANDCVGLISTNFCLPRNSNERYSSTNLESCIQGL